MSLAFFTGHIIPIRGPGDEPLDISELRPELLARWDSYWNEVVRRALEEVVGLEPEASGEERLRRLADAIAACLTCPLLLEPLPAMKADGAEKPEILLTPSRLYYLWLLTRKTHFGFAFWEDERGRPLSLYLIAEQGFKEAPSLFLANKPGLAGLFEEETHERFFELFTRLPADTRPGLNTSRLVVHLLLTSALAYIMACRGGVRGDELELLRLAALLHDVGKPRAWLEMCEKKAYIDHVEASEELAKEILEGLLDEEALEKLLTMIRHHHRPEEAPEDIRRLASMLAEADKAASAEDRLREVVLKPVAEALGMSEGDLEERFNDWGFWLALHQERPSDVREATRKAVNALRQWRRQVSPKEAKEICDGHVQLGLADLRGIQKFIGMAEKLAGLAAGSYIVEAACSYAIPRALVEGRVSVIGPLCPECIIYAGGGNALFLAPSVAEEKEEAIEEDLTKALEELVGGQLTASREPDGLKVSVCLEPLRDPFAKTLADVNLAMSVRKARPPGPSLTRLGLETSCDTCGMRPAEEEGRCSYCIARERLASGAKEEPTGGLILGLKAKWREFGLDELTGLSWGDVSSHVMEFLAGHDIMKERELRPERRLNICFLKFDGNLVGLYMAHTCTIADAVERSMRVDVAAKRALRTMFEAIRRGVEEAVGDGERADLEARRIMLGYLYVGGDDGLLIMPAWAALPAALVLCEEFHLEMGRCLSLAIGIASAKATYNVWSLLDAAAALISEAKGAFREEVLEPCSSFRGCVAFLFTEGGVLSYGVAEGTLRSMRDAGLSLQPLRTVGDGMSLAKLLTTMLDIGEAVGERFYIELFKKAYMTFKLLEGHEKVKELKETAKEVASLKGRAKIGVMTLNIKDAGLLRSLYVRARAAKAEGLKKEVFTALSSLAYELGLVVPAWDIFQAAKFLGGGML